VRSEARQAVEYNGYRLERDKESGWLHYGSTTALGSVWIAGASKYGPWLLSIDHSGASAVLGQELGAAASTPVQGPGLATFLFATPTALHAALDRAYKLSMSLSDRRSRSSAPGPPRCRRIPRRNAS
jgi:hypothetical protein